MDNPQHPDPSQELPPPPEEKLLPAPTFWQKNGTWINWLLFIFLLVELVAGGLYAQNIIGAPKTSETLPQPTAAVTEIPTTLPEQPTTVPVQKDEVMCTLDAKQCPDGSYVGRTGPNCEFVCPAPTQKADGVHD